MKTQEIADFLSGELTGDSDVDIRGVADLNSAEVGELGFTTADVLLDDCNASCVIVPRSFIPSHPIPTIAVDDPKLSFALIAEVLHPGRRQQAEIHSSAVISSSATLGSGIFVGAFVTVDDDSSIGNDCQMHAGVRIGRKVSIGTNCVFGPNVCINENTVIGNNVILHAGVVIGTDGFGFVRAKERYVKFPQIGRVVIEDNVEIGANSCIDRGALGETLIGEGTKIDNLVQIAHNVQIGKRVVIAAQTGISGSTVIEDDCVIGGQVGMGDHARVLSGAVIGSQAGVLPGKIVRPGVWWGTPVQPLDEYKRQNAMVKGLSRLRDDVKELKKRSNPD